MTTPHERHLIASRLREAREALGLTQTDVATALGIPRTAVSALETGHRAVSGLEARRMARLYRRPVGWLLGGDPDPAVTDDLHAATARLGDADRERVLQFARFLAHQTRAS